MPFCTNSKRFARRLHGTHVPFTSKAPLQPNETLGDLFMEINILTRRSSTRDASAVFVNALNAKANVHSDVAAEWI